MGHTIERNQKPFGRLSAGRVLPEARPTRACEIIVGKFAPHHPGNSGIRLTTVNQVLTSGEPVAGRAARGCCRATRVGMADRCRESREQLARIRGLALRAYRRFGIQADQIFILVAAVSASELIYRHGDSLVLFRFSSFVRLSLAGTGPPLMLPQSPL